jgi:hypothetical protein
MRLLGGTAPRQAPKKRGDDEPKYEPTQCQRQADKGTSPHARAWPEELVVKRPDADEERERE